MQGNTRFKKEILFEFRKNCLRDRVLCSLRMIDSRLLRKDTLSSVIIGVVPRRSDKEVCWLDILWIFFVLSKLGKRTFAYVFCRDF